MNCETLNKLFCCAIFYNIVPVVLIPFIIVYAAYRYISKIFIHLFYPPCELILNGLDSLWFHDSYSNQPIINSFMELDGTLTLQRFRYLVENRVINSKNDQGERIGRRFKLKHKVFLRRCVWIEDKDFNIANHVYQHTLNDGSPCDKNDLPKIMSEYFSQKIDSEQPMWSFILVPFTDGTTTFLIRIHHAYGDGMAILKFVLSCFVDQDEKVKEVLKKSKIPSKKEEWALTMALQAIFDAPYLLAKQMFLKSDKNPFHGKKLSNKKLVSWSKSIPLQVIKDIKNAVGNSTVNDVLLSALTGAFHRYFTTQESPENSGLKCLIPVAMRTSSKMVLDNQITILPVSLPIQIELPLERLLKITETISEIKNSSATLVNYLTGLFISSHLPTWMSNALFRLMIIKSTTVVSNIPGPEAEVTFDSIKVPRMLFWTPSPDIIGVTISLLTYNSQFYVGVLADEVLLKKPEIFVRFVEEEISALSDAIKIKNQ